MKKRRRSVLHAIPVALALGAGGYLVFEPTWERPPEEDGTAPGPLGEGQFRAVTLNAWKLSQPERVPRLVAALETAGRLLAADAAADLPELVAIQEIESREALAALAGALEGTHHVVACVCALRDDGRPRSAVLLAASRSVFEARGERCIELGQAWPDHGRCAAELHLARGERTLSAMTTHLSWHPDSAPMVERLRRDVAIDGPTVWLGDFNTPDEGEARARLLEAPLRDARPGAPPTHYVGRRVDLVLVTGELEVVRGLSRRASFDALEPSDSFRLPGLPYGLEDRRCQTEPAECPVSDHLPEGAVLALR